MGGARIPIELAGVTFETKKQLEEHVRGTLYAGDPGSALSADDSALVLALLQRHPDAVEIIGVGVASIKRSGGWHATRGVQSFVAVRTDGTSTSFSFTHCIYPPSERTRIASACRQAVFDDVGDFKRAAFDGNETLICPVSGVEITLADSHVDHDREVASFDALVTGFLASEASAPVIAGYRDNEPFTRFADPAVAERFRAYHNRHASLRVISARANRRDKKGPLVLDFDGARLEDAAESASQHADPEHPLGSPITSPEQAASYYRQVRQLRYQLDLVEQEYQEFARANGPFEIAPGVAYGLRERVGNEAVDIRAEGAREALRLLLEEEEEEALVATKASIERAAGLRAKRLGADKGADRRIASEVLAALRELGAIRRGASSERFAEFKVAP